MALLSISGFSQQQAHTKLIGDALGRGNSEELAGLFPTLDSINTPFNQNGLPPLHYALSTRSTGVIYSVRWLLDHGANPALAAGAGALTPLMIAAQNERQGDQLVEELLRRAPELRLSLATTYDAKGHNCFYHARELNENSTLSTRIIGLLEGRSLVDELADSLTTTAL
jgi:ankyrin repeat protein